MKELAKYVARSNSAKHLGQRPSFLALIRSVDPRWPSIGARVLGRSLKEMTRSIKTEYKKEFSNQHVALTSDIWTSAAQDAFITVTVHYIGEDWRMHTRILGTTVFNEKHDSVNIERKLSDIRGDFGLLPKRAPGQGDAAVNVYDRPALTTDNAANISKAAEMHLAYD